MALISFPAIELKGGQVVRLAEGDMDRATVYADDPAGKAELFYKQNATHLHVVDLDGDFAVCSVNTQPVEGILKAFNGKVQLGGGILDRSAIDSLLSLHVNRVVFCTPPIRYPG